MCGPASWDASVLYFPGVLDLGSARRLLRSRIHSDQRIIGGSIVSGLGPSHDDMMMFSLLLFSPLNTFLDFGKENITITLHYLHGYLYLANKSR